MDLRVNIPDHIINIINLYEGQIGRRKLAEIANITEQDARFLLRAYNERVTEFEPESVFLRKSLQKSRDKLRVTRADYRVEDRYYNTLEEYTKELIETVKAHKPPDTMYHDQIYTESSGISQISDIHFNELIEILGNTYDFTIASKRLQKLAFETIPIYLACNVDEVLVAMTGDMMNSDRRLDELLNNCTNRARATFLSAMVIEQFITHLNQYFNIKVAYTTGNESRKSKEILYSDIGASDNYDTMIFELLKLRFLGCEGVEFIDGDASEILVPLRNKNILMMHGHQVAGGIDAPVGRKIQQIKGKYSDLGIIVDYFIFGHLHDTRIGDTYGRSPALCGANAYSYNALQLPSRAGQLIHIVKDDCINAMKIDLQETGDLRGYEIDKALEAYNAKSAKKVESMRDKRI